MTTPQNELHNISYGVSRIQRMLLGEDHEDSMMERLVSIDEELAKIDRMQDQLALIIKLLGKQ